MKCGEQVVSRGLWPPQSSDLNCYKNYLWGMPKGEVYVNNSHSLEELEGNNRHEMSTIPVQQL